MMVLNKAGYYNQYQMVPLQSGDFSQTATFLCLNVKIETELDAFPVSSHSQFSVGFAAQTLGDIHLDKDCILHNIFFRKQQMFSGPPCTISEPRVSLSFRFSVFAFGNGKHFLFLWFTHSVGSPPWGNTPHGLQVSTPFAVGKQTYHQIGSSDSLGEQAGRAKRGVFKQILFAMENQGKSKKTHS